MPDSGDRQIVTCALDRQVRWVDVDTGTHTTLATCRQFCAKVAFVPGSAHAFLTAGQDVRSGGGSGSGSGSRRSSE